MPEGTAFLSLALPEQSEILNSFAQTLGRSAQVLEKDIWVCWTLDRLFSIPNAKPMAFKGGTSLSKAYRIIERFSEDVDVTLDLRTETDPDPFAAGRSKSQRNDYGKVLIKRLRDYTQTTLLPYFQQSLRNSCAGAGRVEVVDSGLYIYYPTVHSELDGYIQPRVFLELGARNAAVPTEAFTLQAEVSSIAPSGLHFPAARVDVLTIERTFWEKATLIHVACLLGQLKPNAERISRHWFDLVQLDNAGITERAMSIPDLLEDVVRYKQTFFKVPHDGDYQDCLKRAFQLVPAGVMLTQLETDYDQMISARMLHGQPLAFSNLLESIDSIQDRLNRALD